MSASVHFLPNANAVPFPRKGRGRLPACVTSLARYRVARMHQAQDERETDRITYNDARLQALADLIAQRVAAATPASPRPPAA